MEVDFIPYNFGNNLSKYRRELLLIGVTYYDRFLVFEHLNKPIDRIFDLPVSSIEITFKKENEQMVAVMLLVECNSTKELSALIQHNLNKEPKLAIQEKGEKLDRLKYYWKGKEHLLGIGTRESENLFFIYFTLKKFRLH